MLEQILFQRNLSLCSNRERGHFCLLTGIIMVRHYCLTVKWATREPFGGWPDAASSLELRYVMERLLPGNLPSMKHKSALNPLARLKTARNFDHFNMPGTDLR